MESCEQLFADLCLVPFFFFCTAGSLFSKLLLFSLLLTPLPLPQHSHLCCQRLRFIMNTALMYYHGPCIHHFVSPFVFLPFFLKATAGIISSL